MHKHDLPEIGGGERYLRRRHFIAIPGEMGQLSGNSARRGDARDLRISRPRKTDGSKDDRGAVRGERGVLGGQVWIAVENLRVHRRGAGYVDNTNRAERAARSIWSDGDHFGAVSGQ